MQVEISIILRKKSSTDNIRIFPLHNSHIHGVSFSLKIKKTQEKETLHLSVCVTDFCKHFCKKKPARENYTQLITRQNRPKESEKKKKTKNRRDNKRNKKETLLLQKSEGKTLDNIFIKKQTNKNKERKRETENMKDV